MLCVYPLLNCTNFHRKKKQKKDVGMGLLVYNMSCLHTAIQATSSFCGFGTAIPTSFNIFINVFNKVIENSSLKQKKDVGMGLLVYNMSCLHTAIQATPIFCGFGTAIPTSYNIFINVFDTCLYPFSCTNKKVFCSCKVLSESLKQIKQPLLPVRNRVERGLTRRSLTSITPV